MSDATASTSRRPGLVRKVGIGFVLLVLLLVILYFTGTSSAFIKAFVLPRVGRALNATVTADDVALSPFSSLTVRGLAVRTVGDTPLATVAEVRVRYRLMDILRGRITVDELTLEAPVVQVLPAGEGRTNLDPLLAGTASTTPPPPSAAGGKPVDLNVRSVSLRNGTLRGVMPAGTNSAGAKVEVSGLALSLDRLVAGSPGRLDIAAAVKTEQASAGGVNGAEADLKGQLDLTLDATARPVSAQGSVRLGVRQATGSFASWKSLASSLDVNLTPTELKRLALSFEQGGRVLGSVTASGPLDASRREGNLTLQVSGIDRALLGTVLSPLGIDPGSTTLGITSEVQLSRGGTQVRAKGRVAADRLSVSQAGKTTPVVDLGLGFDASADLTARNVRVELCNLEASQGGRAVLKGALTAPMSVSWAGAGAAAGGDGSFQVTLNDLNLADWAPFLGGGVTAGRVRGGLVLGSRAGGDQLDFKSDLEAVDLSLRLGTNALTQAGAKVQASATIASLQSLKLDPLALALTVGGNPALAVEGSAGFGSKTGDFNARAVVRVVPARLLGSGPRDEIRIGLDTEGSVGPAVVEVRRLAASLPPTSKAPTNSLVAHGRVDRSQPSAMKGNLVAESSILDLTDLYRLYSASRPAPPAPVPGSSPTNSAPAFPRTEPEPLTLPFRPLQADIRIGRLLLGEVEITGLNGSLSVDGGHVRLAPFQMSCNGAPVQATVDADLAVRGMRYDVALQAGGLPLEPIANTFSPSMKGLASGKLYANAQLKGAGITGASLQRSLAGQMNIVVTNASIQLVSGSQRIWFLPLDVNSIARLLRVPEITRSPVTLVDMAAVAGGGKIDLSHAIVRADAFMAQATGTVGIADPLETSPLRVPLDFYLSREVARKASLLPSDLPPDAPYAKLPPIAEVVGTLAKVETRTDQAQILKLTARATAGLVGGGAVGVVDSVGKAVGNLGDNLGNLLSGRKPGSGPTNAAPATNQSGGLNPLNLFRKKQ